MSTSGQNAEDNAALAAFRRAAAAWPGIPVDAAAFCGHLARLLQAGGQPGELHVEDLYLALACAHRQPLALERMAQAIHDEVEGALRRMSGPPGMAEEVEQQLRERLLVGEGRPKILDYGGRGTLSKWLRAAAVRTALTVRRAGRREVAADEDELLELPAANQDPELRLIQASYRKAFSAAFQSALASLDPQQRNLLRLQLLDGLNIDQIGGIYAAHRSTAARWLAKAREELLTRTREALGTALRLSPQELDSLMGQLHSQLDVSLRRFLCETAGVAKGGATRAT